MKEKSRKTIEKALSVEESGETLSIKICLENVSPNVKVDTITSFLDILFEKGKEELNFYYSRVK